ncbi:helix-turn-helix domain-containing protein [Haemophilus influenzae]|nr:helix-turn-helix domain-containing protein [Haemophilus influenzae]
MRACPSPIRLAIFQQLTAAGSTGMIAGDLAKQLNLAPNNVSFHLKKPVAFGACACGAGRTAHALFCRAGFDDGIDPFSDPKLLFSNRRILPVIFRQPEKIIAKYFYILERLE